jgi:alpha-L-arabinofuranosidase
LEPRRLLSNGPIPPVPTPAALWTFDEGSGTIAHDSSGNGFTATLGTGASWTAGNVGSGAISLNGTAGAVATVNQPVVNTAGSFTVSAWVDFAALGGYQTVVSIAGNNVAGFFLQLRGDTGTFAFTRLASDSTSAATFYASDPNAPTAGTWYHLVGVDDANAGTLTLYVDGQSVGSVAYTGGWQAGGDTLIGHGFYSAGEVDYVDGSIDQVQVFNSALTAAQIQALDEPAAYAFDDGSGTTAADVSGHGNTLTLGSGASWGPGYIGSNSLEVNGTATGNATDISPVLNTSMPFSVSAWVNLNNVTGTQTFVSIDGTNTSGFYLQYRSDTGTFAFTRLGSDSTSATVYQADATFTPSTGEWYNLIGVNDPATEQIQLYVDGVLQNTVSYTGGWYAKGETVIGGGLWNGVPSDFTNGYIDDVIFYNSPLSANDAAYVGTNGSSLIDINTTSTGVTVSPNLFGAFMEDINYAGEGGMDNNEVQNSGFNESGNALTAWSAVTSPGVTANLSSDTTTGPTSALTESGALTITSGVSATARAGIANSGYFGIGIEPSTTYSVMFYAKASPGFTGPLTIDIESTTGTVWATATVPSITSSWAQYNVTLTTNASTPTTATNQFVIYTNSPNANGKTIWFGATYLYPPSYEDQDNHLRVDLMEMLAQLHPAIFRVPGGNYLEGEDYANRFEWSETVGPVQDRPGHEDPWGYWSTDGMGLDEYLQMAEEVGASPILAVYAGYTLNGTSDTGSVLANDVTDAVDELHYCLDPVTTTWGAERAANGHPAPYNIQYVEIGNEDFFSSTYSTRYPLFYDAIHAAFPTLQIIATSTDTGGAPFNVLDEHFYETPAWFEANSNYFNNVNPGYQIFIGEYASNEGSPTGDMNSALGDASWLLGLERNSNVVTMSSYAPLFVNVNGYQWSPDLIGFNNTSAYGSPSYWAQVMLSQNHGTTVINDSVSGATGLQTIVTRTGDTYYLTVINTTGSASNSTIDLSGVTEVSSNGTVTTMSATASNATNSITDPDNIIPDTSSVTGLGTTFTYDFAAYSITILEFTADNAPTVAQAAAANPSPVVAATTNVSAMGSDAAGASTLTYTWSATGPAGVLFSQNGTNAAQNSLATFDKTGTYNLTVTIENSLGGTTTSSTSVVVIPAVFNLNDSGAGSLRQAIIDANGGGSTSISFASGLTGTINLAGALPALSTNVTIQGPTSGTITINGPGSGNVLTINPGATTQLQNITITGGAVANNGTLNIGGSVVTGQIIGSGTLVIGSTSATANLEILPGSASSTVGSLVVNTGSSLNITNNQLFINYGATTDPISSIVALLAKGYNAGAWNGVGINTTAPLTVGGFQYGLGYADSVDPGNPAALSSGTIEIRYTLLGDANLDGIVNGTDFSILAANFGTGATSWDQGNFLYGSSVNGSDFSALSANFGQGVSTAAATSTTTVSAPVASTSNDEASTSSTVAEPKHTTEVSKNSVTATPKPKTSAPAKFAAAAVTTESQNSSTPASTKDRTGDASFLADR